MFYPSRFGSGSMNSDFAREQQPRFSLRIDKGEFLPFVMVDRTGKRRERKFSHEVVAQFAIDSANVAETRP